MKCLIVEDEQNIRGSYRIQGHWNELGIETVLEASDGQAGIELVRAEKPEIIITDMCMSVVDGADFLQLISKESYQPQIIVISGYTDFRYVHSALTIHAIDYLLKPINEERLNKVLQSAIHQYAAHHPTCSQGILDQFIKHMQGHILECTSENEFMNLKVTCDFASSHPYFQLCIPLILNFKEVRKATGYMLDDLLCLKIQQSMETALRQNLQADVLVLHIRDGISWSFVCIIGSDRKALLTKALLERALWAVSFQLCTFSLRTILGYGEQPCLWENFQSMYQFVKNGLYSQRLSGSPAVVCIDSDVEIIQIQPLAAQQKDKIKRCIYEQDELGACNTMGACYEKLVGTELLCARQLMSLGLDVLDIVHEVYEQGAPISGEPLHLNHIWSELINSLDSIPQQLAILSDCIRDACQRSALNIGPQLVPEIIDFIAQNYAQHLTLATLSERFFISREHLCRLLKQETGSTFVEHMTNCRLQHAVRLLQTTKMSAADIAATVGFSDASYMNRLFQKAYGLTPSSL
ncbi:MAG: response regulator, partial [Acinetobacter sp.]